MDNGTEITVVGLLVAMTVTKILIILTVAVWVVWDLVAVMVWGRSATESWRISDWCRRFPWIVFLLGYLCGHWIGFTL